MSWESLPCFRQAYKFTELCWSTFFRPVITASGWTVLPSWESAVAANWPPTAAGSARPPTGILITRRFAKKEEELSSLMKVALHCALSRKMLETRIRHVFLSWNVYVLNLLLSGELVVCSTVTKNLISWKMCNTGNLLCLPSLTLLHFWH